MLGRALPLMAFLIVQGLSVPARADKLALQLTGGAGVGGGVVVGGLGLSIVRTLNVFNEPYDIITSFRRLHAAPALSVDLGVRFASTWVFASRRLRVRRATT